MLGYLTLAGLAVTIGIGLKMHGVKRLPKGTVLPHALLAFSSPVLWAVYLTYGHPVALGWATVAWIVFTNALGDATVLRKWKKKSDGGLGLLGTYLKRVKARPILLVHLSVGGLTTVLAALTVLTW